MNELSNMSKKINFYSMLLGLVAAIGFGFIFQDFYVFLGILIGLLTGLMGYQMIVQLSKTLNLSLGDAKKKGTANYMLRYLIYAIIFFISTYFGIPIIALLGGFLCHKLSILIYVFKEGKEG